MDIQYVYTKIRNQLGQPTNFSDRSADIVAEIVPNANLLQEFIYRNPIDNGVQNSIQFSEHEVNTARYNIESHGVNHTEGGWPKDVNIQELDQINRYRKKLEKDESFLSSFYQLSQDLELSIKQNNAIDIHQMYFEDNVHTSEEPFNVETINMYNYISNVNQMANHLSWQADGLRKLAASYGNIDFQPIRKNTINSLVWDIENPNQPELILRPISSLSTVEFNQKDIHQLLGGCFNGQVCIFDLRKGHTPVDHSSTEFSHREPVRNALWLQSKTNTEFFSASTDGNIFWWDTRKMNQPVDKLILDLEKKERFQYALSITQLEYDSSIPTKFMVGTESGRIVLCSRKANTEAERINVIYPGHSGPIQTIQRHPIFHKIFLSVADWTVRIWSEEIRDDYILSMKPIRSYLTDGQWCPGRPGVLMTSTAGGFVEVWDLLFSQDHPTLTVKLCQEAITCLSFHEQGRYLACGTEDGNVLLTELSDSLCVTDRNEKQLVAAMFDRETRRAHLLDTRSRLKHDHNIRTVLQRSEQEIDEELTKSTEHFWSIINDEKKN